MTAVWQIWDEVIKETANLSDMGAAKLVVFAMLLRIIHLWRVPSMVLGRQDVIINIGVSD